MCISCAHIEEDVDTHTLVYCAGVTNAHSHKLATTLARKQMIVITWGRLRGAVGLALALVAAQTSGVPLGSIGSKVRF